MIRAWLSALLVAFAAFVGLVWLGYAAQGWDDGGQPLVIAIGGGRE